MTLLDRSAPESLRERNIPVLATERLILRAPCFEDARTIAALVNDRRIAENTLRIPHPYGLADAQSFITAANASDGEIVFLIARRGGDVIGGCGIARFGEEPPEIGYWLGVSFWGQGYATEAVRAVIDHAFGDLGYDAGGRRAREQPCFAPGVGKMRLPVDGRRSLSHPRARLVRAGRSFPSRSQAVGHSSRRRTSTPLGSKAGARLSRV
jgi:hypothetical protein